MTSPRNLLVRLAGALNASGMPWMITGSTASAFYGEPRATQDIDIVVDPEGSVVSKLRWAAASGSEMQLRDAASVLAGCSGELDLDYIRREAKAAGVTDLLTKILSQNP